MTQLSNSPSPTQQRSSWVAPSVRRGSSNLRGSILGTRCRRDLLAQQAELDHSVFDSSLGCPLASFDNATLPMVGGKALQCWRLTKHGYPVPCAFVVPTYVYSLHVRSSGVHGLIKEVFAQQDLPPSEEARSLTKKKLESIRRRILETPLNEQVVDNLEAFIASLPPGTPMAVRSSGTSEDLASQSYAGLYDTFLYRSTLEEICDSIKGWGKPFPAPHSRLR